MAARLYKGCPGVAPNSYQGMKDLLCHLIEVHGFRKIAFIAGPEGNWPSRERYRAYVDVLAEHDLPLNPDLVTPPLGWDKGHEGIPILMNQRGLLPGTSFEAIAAAALS